VPQHTAARMVASSNRVACPPMHLTRTVNEFHRPG
jgi:hypothetical protein